MKVNTAKEKMKEGKPAFGYALSQGSPLNAEVLSNCGIDFLLLDRQHGSWGEDSTIAAFTAMASGSAVPMARVARNDYTMIGRLLDEGALGIIVPMVHTPEDAQSSGIRLSTCRPSATAHGDGAAPVPLATTIRLGSMSRSSLPCRSRARWQSKMLKRSWPRLA